MREIPILFSAPMVRALRAGRKTQTRRLANTGRVVGGCLPYFDNMAGHHCNGDDTPVQQRWSVGDLLWVKETWARRLDEDALSASDLTDKTWAWYWADPQTCNTGCAGGAGKRRQSIFMPRWASRIALRVTDVSVQRLRDICEEDARAEGVHWTGRWSDSFSGIAAHDAYGEDILPNVAAYAILWDQINGAGSWASNPWVSAISFEVAK